MHRKMLSQVNRVGASRPAPGPARVPEQQWTEHFASPSHPFWTGSRPPSAEMAPGQFPVHGSQFMVQSAAHGARTRN